MTEKEMKRLSRQELLEMLLTMSRTEKRLRQRIAELERKLGDKTIAIQESGSLAEAALRLNHIFEDADNAVQQYIRNAKAMADLAVQNGGAFPAEAEREPSAAEHRRMEPYLSRLPYIFDRGAEKNGEKGAEDREGAARRGGD